MHRKELSHHISVIAFGAIAAAGCAAGGADAVHPVADAGGQTVTGQALPLTVSDYFAPSGYMGDGATSATAIQMDTTACLMPRPTGAAGDCYKVTYTPGSAGWAGVYWQYPANNWGAAPGKVVQAGATKVGFFAAGAAGGEALMFKAGGENDGTLPYHDAFSASASATLTTAMAPYAIDLTGKSYDAGVLGAFAWTITAPVGSTTPIVFYLDAITWQK